MSGALHVVAVVPSKRHGEFLQSKAAAVLEKVSCSICCSRQELDDTLSIPVDLVICESELPWISSQNLQEKLRSNCALTPVIFLSMAGPPRANGANQLFSGATDVVVVDEPGYKALNETLARWIERLEQQKKIQHVEGRLQHLLNQLQVGAFRADLQGKLLEGNPAFCKLLGAPQGVLSDFSLKDLYFDPAVFQDQWTRVALTGALQEHHLELKRLDGTPVVVSLTARLAQSSAGDPVVDGLMEDISERCQLEIQLRQAQKMESIGRLAAGVAHDFNNILTIIDGYAGLLMAEENVPPASAEALEQIHQAALKGATLTRQLLTFSRKQPLQPTLLDLHDLMNGVARLLNRLLGEDIVLECRSSGPRAVVEADAGMLEQVIINLAVNARDAMSQGGKLVISCRQVTVPARHRKSSPDARPGDFVCLSVLDNGCGIDPRTKEHIFEPFFTTKKDGQGTGLGLSLVYGIVKQHRGWVEVTSEPGKGSEFRVYLPVSRQAAKLDHKPALAAPRGGTETILVVEDEVALRKLVIDILRGYGYRVHEASSAMEALRTWESMPEPLDLLFTDMKTPEGLNGFDLAQRLLKKREELKVVFTTGYSIDLAQQPLELKEGANFLQKPYQLEKLVRTVRNCLDAKD